LKNLELIKSLTLPDFPSGSSINFYDGKLYVIGDDAKSILILDEHYSRHSVIPLFDDLHDRIPKALKPDFETSAIINSEGEDCLLVLGSGSRPNRMRGLLIPLNRATAIEQIKAFDYQEFIERLIANDLGEINIEGSAVVANHCILSNRANGKNPDNKFVVAEIGFWNHPVTTLFSVAALKLPTKSDKTIGVSELCYDPLNDRLLMTLSTEGTDNAYEDGAIGDSYTGWIDNISKKTNDTSIELSGIINLSEDHREFIGEKIEGICIESVTNSNYVLHLVSDDDKGHSKLFKIKLSI